MTTNDEAKAREARRRLRTARAVIRARWQGLGLLVAFGAVAGTMLALEGQIDALIDHVRLPAIIFALYVLTNGALSMVHERIAARTDLHAIQVLPDLLLVTAIVHDSGGAASWLWPLYAILTLEAAVLFESTRRAWAVALAASLLYGGLLWLEHQGVLVTRPMPFVSGALQQSGSYSLLLWLWVTALNTGIAIIGGHLAGQLRDQRERLQRLMDRDPVSGLYARPYLDRRLASESARASRGERLFSVIVPSLPEYPEAIKTLGYVAGDRLLRLVAAQIEGTIPDSLRAVGAVAARIDGGIFALLLPEANPSESAEAAERIRAAVQTAGAVVRAEQVRERVSRLPMAVGANRLVAGIATYGDNGVSGDELLRAAQQAVDAASAEGASPIQLSSHHAAEIRHKQAGGAQ